MDTEFCPICKLHWGVHIGPEFCRHLLLALDQAIRGQVQGAKK